MHTNRKSAFGAVAIAIILVLGILITTSFLKTSSTLLTKSSVSNIEINAFSGTNESILLGNITLTGLPAGTLYSTVQIQITPPNSISKQATAIVNDTNLSNSLSTYFTIETVISPQIPGSTSPWKTTYGGFGLWPSSYGGIIFGTSAGLLVSGPNSLKLDSVNMNLSAGSYNLSVYLLIQFWNYTGNPMNTTAYCNLALTNLTVDEMHSGIFEGAGTATYS